MGRGPMSGPVSTEDVPAHVGRQTARRVVPLFRPYRRQVGAVVGLIVLTSTIGIVNPLLIQAVFNDALFVRGGPKLHLLYVLVGVMAAVPIVNGGIGILQTYETNKVGQHVMRDLRDGLYSHLQTLSLAFFTRTKTGEIQSRLANDVGGVESVVTTTASTILANVVHLRLKHRGHGHPLVGADHRVGDHRACVLLPDAVRRRAPPGGVEEHAGVVGAMSAISEETLSVSGSCSRRSSATRCATSPATARRTSASPTSRCASR